MTNRVLKSTIFVFLSVALAISSRIVYAAPETITFKLAHAYAVDGVVDLVMKHFAARVDELSGGKMKVEVYPGGVLGTWRECLESMSFGTVDMVAESLGTMESYTKLAGLEGAPYLYTDANHFYRVWEGPVGKQVIDTIADQTNRRMITVMWRGARQLATVKPVKTLADLKGLKIRVPTEDTYVKTWQALGASPTPMALSEVYTALQQKVIEGVEQPINVMLEESWTDVCKYLTMTYHAAEPFGIIVWNPTYQKLSVDNRQIIDLAAQDATERMKQIISKAEDDALIEMKTQGVTIFTPDLTEFREAASKTELDPQVQKYADLIRNVK